MLRRHTEEFRRVLGQKFNYRLARPFLLTLALDGEPSLLRLIHLNLLCSSTFDFDQRTTAIDSRERSMFVLNLCSVTNRSSQPAGT